MKVFSNGFCCFAILIAECFTMAIARKRMKSRMDAIHQDGTKSYRSEPSNEVLEGRCMVDVVLAGLLRENLFPNEGILPSLI